MSWCQSSQGMVGGEHSQRGSWVNIDGALAFREGTDPGIFSSGGQWWVAPCPQCSISPGTYPRGVWPQSPQLWYSPRVRHSPQESPVPVTTDSESEGSSHLGHKWLQKKPHLHCYCMSTWVAAVARVCSPEVGCTCLHLVLCPQGQLWPECPLLWEWYFWAWVGIRKWPRPNLKLMSMPQPCSLHHYQCGERV